MTRPAVLSCCDTLVIIIIEDSSGDKIASSLLRKRVSNCLNRELHFCLKCIVVFWLISCHGMDSSAPRRDSGPCRITAHGGGIRCVQEGHAVSALAKATGSYGSSALKPEPSLDICALSTWSNGLTLGYSSYLTISARNRFGVRDKNYCGKARVQSTLPLPFI
jgi:hypothetical protein